MAIQANEITVRLTVQDDATRPLNRTQRELDETGREGREAFVKIQVAADRAGRELKDFESKSNRTRISIAKLATGIIGVAAAFEGIRRTVGTGLGFIQAASEFEEAAAKFGVVFGDEAVRVAEDFENLSSVVRRSQVELVTAASSFQDLFVPMGLSREAAADLSTEMVKLAVDVASFNNAQDVDVIRNFQSALVGETEAVRKYGVLLDEARLKQLAYQNGIADAGAELTQQQKVLTRILALYADTTDAQGDAARTADSFANTIKGIRGAAKDLEVVFGQELVAATRDVLEELGGVDGVVELIKVGFGITSEVTKVFIRVLGELAKTAKSFIDGFGGADKLIRAFRGELEQTPAAAQAFENAFRRLPEVFAASGKAMLALAGVIGEQLADVLFGGFGTSIDRVISKTIAQVTVGAGKRAGESLTDAAARAIDEGAVKTNLSATLLAKAITDPLNELDLKAARLQLANSLGLLPELLQNTRGGIAEEFRILGTDATSSFQTAIIDFGNTAPEALDIAFRSIADRVDDNDLEKALARNLRSIRALDKDFAQIDEIAGIGKAKIALDSALSDLRSSLDSAAGELGSAFVDAAERIELRASDFFRVEAGDFGILDPILENIDRELEAYDPSTDPLLALIEATNDTAARGGLLAAIASTLDDPQGEKVIVSKATETGNKYVVALVESIKSGLKTLGTEFADLTEALAFEQMIEEQTESVTTLNAILAGTFNEASDKVTDYYEKLREAAIARADSSRESQQLLLEELDLLAKLEERDKKAAENAKAKEDAIRAFGEALGDQAIAVQLQLGLEQQFQQLIAGLSRSFVDSEASFADFRDAFLQGIAQMIVQALILKSLTLLFGGTAFGNFLGLGAPGAAKGGVFTGVGSMAVGDAPGVTKGDGGTNGTFYFAKGGVMKGERTMKAHADELKMFAKGGLLEDIGSELHAFAKGGIMPGSMGLPIKQYATGGVARTPQLAVFGEGRGAEAFVPLPDGARIPVKMEGGAQEVTVNLSVQSLDPRGAADVVLAQMPLIRKEIAGALREGSDRTLLEGVRGASRR